MAVIQISKIQLRRGAIGEQGMPQLASGEMGWAVDTQQLFIGNGSIAEGAPAIGNTEILTQYSTATINLFDCLYSYKDREGGPLLLTGTATNFMVERTLQERLEDTVSVLDFGAKGDGITDDTAAIQRALKQHYITVGTIPYRKTIFFPAGRYIVTGTVFIPPYASIEGEGPDRTILRTISTADTTILRTRSISGNDFLDLTLTAESTTVTSVSIKGMTFEYSPSHNYTSVSTDPLVVLDQTVDSTVQNCHFLGTYTGTGSLPYSLYEGIYATGNLSKNLVVEGSTFSRLYAGFINVNNVEDHHIKNSNFYYSRYGVISGSTSGVTGPLRTVVENCVFRDITQNGIIVEVPTTNIWTATSFISKGNLFKNVGNNGFAAKDNAQSSNIIDFGTAKNCSSVDDTFLRFNETNTFYSTATFKPFINAPVVSLYDNTPYHYTLNTTTNINSYKTLLSIPHMNTATNVIMDYSIYKTGASRFGSLVVNASSVLNQVSYKDNYNYQNNDCDAVFSATLVSSEGNAVFDKLSITYTNPVVSSGTISLSLRTLSN